LKKKVADRGSDYPRNPIQDEGENLRCMKTEGLTTPEFPGSDPNLKYRVDTMTIPISGFLGCCRQVGLQVFQVAIYPRST